MNHKKKNNKKIRKSEKLKGKPPKDSLVQENEIIANKIPETENNEPKENNMEVHHHPDLHHKRKKFKEYFLEFIMIFLAVTMGFFAESYRESRADRAKEVEYINSMIEDSKTDIINYDQAILQNNSRISSLDSLAKFISNYSVDNNTDFTIYRLFRKCLGHPSLVTPTERTLMQLKNSGGMRLVQNKIAADSIVQYDDFAKKLDDQKGAYEVYFNKMIEQSLAIFDYSYFNMDSIPKKTIVDYSPNNPPKLHETDKTKLLEFSNKALFFKAVVYFYNFRLSEGKKHSTNLINTLKSEYEL